MANLKKFNETINNGGKRSVDFAAHFATNSSIKNLLKIAGHGHEKTLTKAFDDKFEKLLVGSDAVLEPLVNLAEQAFAATVAENEKWVADGNTKSLPERVAYLVGTFGGYVKNTDDGKALVVAIGQLMIGDPDISKLSHDLEKDGFDKDKITDCLIDVLMYVGMRYIITAGANYVAPVATDENGQPVVVEVITPNGNHQQPVSSAGAGHSTGKSDSQEPETPQPEEQKPEETPVDCYTLIVKNLKDAKTENDVFDNIKKLIDELGSTASDDMIHMASNVLRPYSKGIVNSIINGIVAITPKVADEGNPTYDYARNVLHGMFPHNWDTDVNVEALVDVFCTRLTNANFDPEIDYDECCINLTASAGIMYKLIAMTGTDHHDVVNGYRLLLEMWKAMEAGIDDITTARFLINGLDKDLPGIMARVNKQIERPWERTHGTFDTMITGMWANAAERLLKNGLTLIGKVA